MIRSSDSRETASASPGGSKISSCPKGIFSHGGQKENPGVPVNQPLNERSRAAEGGERESALHGGQAFADRVLGGLRAAVQVELLRGVPAMAVPCGRGGG